MLRSLRSQLTLLLLGLLILLALVTGYATLTTMRNDSEQQAQQLLDVATKVFRQTLQVRSNQLIDTVRLLASDFGFRQAVATAEADTINSVLENHGARINSDLAILFSTNGELLASTKPLQDKSVLVALLQQARQQQESQASIISIDDMAYQIVLVPVRAPRIIAWVGMGFSIDSNLAVQIRELTGLEVSFTKLAVQQRQLLSSTLDGQLQQNFQTDMQQWSLYTGQLLSGQPPQHISQGFSLSGEQQLWAFLHLPNERWLANYQQLRLRLLQIFSLGLALVLVVAFIYTRSVTRPLDKLVDFATAIGRGQQVATPAVALSEVRVLASTLTQMRAAIYQREQQLQRQAEHDTLTGLPNRLAVDKHLPALLATGDALLLQINIVKFRFVNDSFGYANGDVLLQQLAIRLNSLTEHRLCARLGADEFLLVLTQPTSEVALQSMLQHLSAPFDLAGSTIHLSLLAGAYPCTSGTDDVNMLLRRLDIALNNAREQGLGLMFYQTGQDESHQRELTIIRDLPLALKSGQFSVVFQPKVDIQHQRCIAAEALVRWHHPQLGFISPMEFILLAERSGNISMISDWMLKAVISQLANWQQQHPQLAVAVNLSAADLLDDSLPARILGWLAEAGVSVTALTLEVTESAVMQDTGKVVANLQQLKAAGIKLAIDDFGTGQSSLAYLKNLPVNELKIDRAFIKDIEHNSQDALIVQATAQLAMGLGLSVTAEGLENQAGLSRVLAAGCQQVQGYYFAKPLAAADFSLWLQQFACDNKRFFTTVEPVPADPATLPVAG